MGYTDVLVNISCQCCYYVIGLCCVLNLNANPSLCQTFCNNLSILCAQAHFNHVLNESFNVFFFIMP